MKQKISNEKEFQENLKKLGDLYEEGKDCTRQMISVNPSQSEREAFNRMTGILKEMRDLAAVQMQRNHFIDEN